VAYILAYQAGRALNPPFLALEVAQTMLIASCLINLGCIMGIFYHKRLRNRLVGSIRDSRRIAVWLFIALYLASILWAPYNGFLIPASNIISLITFGLFGSILSIADIYLSFKRVIIIAIVVLSLSVFYDGIVIPGIPLNDSIEYQLYLESDYFMKMRRIGILPSASYDGAFIALGIIGAYLISRRQRNTNSLFILLGVILVMLHVVLIQARVVLVAGALIVFSGGFLAIISSRRMRPRRLLGVVAIASMMVFVIYLFINPIMLSRPSIADDQGRIDIYRVGWNAIINGPILGTGFGSNAGPMEKAVLINKQATGPAGGIDGAHSNFVNFGIEIGILGMTLWIVILIWTFLSWLRFVIIGPSNFLRRNSVDQFSLLSLGFVGYAIVIASLFHTLIFIPWLWYMIFHDFRKI
jgi:O-antigen ligase